MADTANLEIGDQKYSLNLIKGTEEELAVDISKLRKESRVITFDDGYGNTGSCESDITFIDGDKGILRYRGYDIAELAEKSNFLESAYLLLNGNLPNGDELDSFRQRVAGYCDLPDQVLASIRSLPAGAHPMAVLSSSLQALGGSYPQYGTNDRNKDLESFDETSALIISSVRSIAAAIYKKSLGEDLPSSDPSKSLLREFSLHDV